MYPKELYKDGQYRVVWGPEEEHKFVSKGWSEDKQDGVEYVVHTAVAADVAPAAKAKGKTKAEAAVPA